MSADTRLRLSSLYVSAFELIEKRARTPEMIEALLKALQLFKENTLLATDVYRVNEVTPSMILRTQLRARIAAGEEGIIYREIIERLSARTRNALTSNNINSFRSLLHACSLSYKSSPSRPPLFHVWGIGKKAGMVILQELRARGLHPSITSEEIDWLFSS